MLSAEYVDAKACPRCGKPARKIGRWYIERGEWRFSPQAVAVSGPKTSPPESEGEMWHLFSHNVDVIDPRTGIAKGKRVEEWFRLAHYECISGRHDESDECGVFHMTEVRPYRGDHFEWMDAPKPPESRKEELDIIMSQTRGKMEAAGDIR